MNIWLNIWARSIRVGTHTICRFIVCLDSFGDINLLMIIAWRWFEREEAVKTHCARNSSVYEFYNVALERHSDDERGYDILYVDAMEKASFASRLSHSCDTNCQLVTMASGGRYVLAILTIKPVHPREELTIDYHAVSDRHIEQKQARCLCGAKRCRRHYLEYTGANATASSKDKNSDGDIVNEHHNMLERVTLLLRSCDPHRKMTYDDVAICDRLGFRACILDGLPTWAVKYSARILEFIEYEHHLLPLRLVGHTSLMTHHKAYQRPWLGATTATAAGSHHHHDERHDDALADAIATVILLHFNDLVSAVMLLDRLFLCWCNRRMMSNINASNI
jgi:hypothetical protein